MSEREVSKCREKNRLGEPCRNVAEEGLELCWWHNPAREEDHREARKKGGRASRLVQGAMYRRKRLVATPEALEGWREDVVAQIRTGELGIEEGTKVLRVIDGHRQHQTPRVVAATVVTDEGEAGGGW